LIPRQVSRVSRIEDLRTFREGVLGGRESVKGFRVVATDGRAGRVSWATYAPGDSYLVLTTGLLRKTHRVLPAHAVTSVADGEVRVALNRAAIEHLPVLPDPQAPIAGAENFEQMLNAFERAYTVAGFPRN
jgi:hypothetical protein